MEVRFKFDSDGRIMREEIKNLDDFYCLFGDEDHRMTVDFEHDKNGKEFIGVTIHDSWKTVIGFKG